MKVNNVCKATKCSVHFYHEFSIINVTKGVIMETFGERLARLRKDANMTQDHLSEKLHVSRQTISAWERDRSEPDLKMLNQIGDLFHIDMNELLNGIAKKKPHSNMLRYVFFLTTILQITFSIYLFVQYKEKSIGGIILQFVLFAINFTMYFIIGYMIKNEDYNLLAGYNEGIEYNLEELEKMLLRLRMSCVCATLVWTILLLLLYLGDYQEFWPLVCVAYTFDFIGRILLENYRSRKKILKNEKDIIASKRSYLSIIIFILLLFAWVVTIIAVMEMQAIKNNTKEAVVLIFFLLGFMIINIIYLCLVQWYVRKETYQKKREMMISIIIVVINIICMIGLFLY